MYHPNGVIRSTYYADRCAVQCFIHSGILTAAPEKFLWAGIGDSIAKEYESELASRSKNLPMRLPWVSFWRMPSQVR